MSMETQCNYSRKQIDRAGKKAIEESTKPHEYEESLAIINSWRAVHTSPMNKYAVNLKKIVKTIPDAIVVQRLKRLETILDKLERMPDMKLSRMQDIGGCRVVVPTVEDVYFVVDKVQKSKMKHTIKDPVDYIKCPSAKDGYRSVHLICKYADRDFEKSIELQIRTKLQHLWATAVETIDTLYNENLKKDQGSEEWTRFFKLVSALFSIEENTPIVEGVPTDAQSILNEIAELDNKFSLIEKLVTVSVAVISDITKKSKSGYYLMSYDFEKVHLTVKIFSNDELNLAIDEYNALENQDNGNNVVLVKARSYAQLKNAYPNYFTDIRAFFKILIEIINKNK